MSGVRITIADSGGGITAEHKKNIFQPFFTTKSDVGTGLGLWITRGIVEKHGGTIRLKSKSADREHGTTFSIFLPFNGTAAAAPSTQKAARGILAGASCAMKVIVIDDEPVIADTLVNILNGEGHQAIATSNGKAAIEWATRFIPEVIVSDVIMPELNGIETAKAILNKIPNCRIILFSGQGASADLLAKARAEGYAFEMLSKPIDPDVLLNALGS